MVPAAGACSRTVPLPVTSTSRPAPAAAEMTWRMERPMSEGTFRVRPVGTTTEAVDSDEGTEAGCEDGVAEVIGEVVCAAVVGFCSGAAGCGGAELAC